MARLRQMPRSGASVHGDYPAVYDLEPPDVGPGFRRHRGVMVPFGWSTERADLLVDEMAQDYATGSFDEDPGPHPYDYAEDGL